MSEKRDGGSAFPQMQCCDEEGRISPVVIGGMSLRDWFAGLAMQGILANPDIDFPVDNSAVHAAYAKHSYMAADAILKAREVSDENHN